MFFNWNSVQLSWYRLNESGFEAFNSSSAELLLSGQRGGEKPLALLFVLHLTRNWGAALLSRSDQIRFARSEVFFFCFLFFGLFVFFGGWSKELLKMELSQWRPQVSTLAPGVLNKRLSDVQRFCLPGGEPVSLVWAKLEVRHFHKSAESSGVNKDVCFFCSASPWNVDSIQQGSPRTEGRT